MKYYYRMASLRSALTFLGALAARGRVALLPAMAVAMLCVGEARADVWNGVLGYWSLNGTTADQSGNGNTLTLFGGASFAAGGQFGNALSLNGAEGSYAQQATNNAAFDFGANDFTIQVWVNFAAKNYEATLIEKFTGCCGAAGWTFTTPNQTQFYASGIGPYNSAGISYPTGVWQQFVAERNGSSLEIYLNNTLIEVGAISGAITSSSTPLLIGARNSGDGRNFTVDGLIDDVGIWDRALSRTEIGTLWNNSNGLQFPSAVPEASTWAMMLLGFAGLGFVGYRRNKSAESPLSVMTGLAATGANAALSAGRR